MYSHKEFIDLLIQMRVLQSRERLNIIQYRFNALNPLTYVTLFVMCAISLLCGALWQFKDIMRVGWNWS